VGEVLEDAGADEVRAGEHQRLAGAFAESGDESILEPDGREAIALGGMAQRERGERVARSARGDEVVPAGELHGVAVDEKKVSFLREQRADGPDDAARSEDLLLEGEVKLRLPEVVHAKVPLDRLGEVMHVDDEIADAGGEERLHRP